MEAPIPVAAGQGKSGQERSAKIELFRVRREALIRERAMGVLDYQGEEFPIEVQGLSPAKFGHRVTLQVYNLTRLDDLDGVFQLADEKTTSAQGPRCCLMRNERGVAIRFADEQNGGDIAFDANGVTIAVASRPVEVKMPMTQGGLAAFLPESAGFGSHYVGPLLVTPTLNVQTDGFAEANNGWGGEFNEPLRDSRFFFEQSNEEGLNASLNLGRYGIIVGRTSAIFSMTCGGLDAGASNADDLQPWDYALESGYLEWA